MESLRITSGLHAGEPFTLRPWQREIIQAWYRTGRDGRRLVRTGLLTLGRKNGKTSLCAALCLAHLVGPEVEARGQVISAASDRDQSGLIFDELVAFILDNEVFAARTNIQRHAKIIEDLPTGTKYRALSSDAAKAHGLSPSVMVLDELAQWGSTGPGKKLYEALTTATGARKEPLTLVISTQTPDPHSLMTELVDYGHEVNAGRVTDPTMSAHIFEVPMDADPWDETVWPLANPALGDFRSLEEMQTFAARAKRMPGQTAMFRAYYLNQRVQAETQWLSVLEWDACATRTGPIEAGRRVFLGLDLSATTDLTALAIWAPNEGGGYDVEVDFWCPEDTIAERSRVDRVPYVQWAKGGHITPTGGNIVQYSAVRARIDVLTRLYDVQEIGVDPWNAKGFVAQMQADNLPAFEVPQTMANLTSASKALETLILSRRLRHTGHPVLRSHVSNAVADMDHNGNIKPSKLRSRERIDGVSALVTGLARALLDVTKPSVYEERGALTISRVR